MKLVKLLYEKVIFDFSDVICENSGTSIRCYFTELLQNTHRQVAIMTNRFLPPNCIKSLS